jgi:glycosyltransferase involved in cell wall biosynthesis
MIRLLFVLGTADIGGTERFVQGLTGQLDAARFRSALVVMGPTGPLSEEYARGGRQVWHLHWRTAEPGRVLLAWQGILREWRPDLIVACGFRANMLARLMAGGVPVVNALRSVVLDDLGRPWARRLDRLTFGRVRACIANSRIAIKVHTDDGFPAARFTWIPNGIDLERFRGPDRESARRRYGVDDGVPVVLCVANLRPVKNHALLLRASRDVHDRGVPHRLWLFGDGPDRSVLEDLAGSLGIAHAVEFLGAAADLPERCAAGDVFALASDFEGMPTAMLEGMAAGLPVVATDVGDVRALCGDAGLVVPPGDQGQFAAGLARLLGDAALRATMRERAAARAARYSLATMTERYARIFEHIVSGGTGLPPEVSA